MQSTHCTRGTNIPDQRLVHHEGGGRGRPTAPRRRRRGRFRRRRTGFPDARQHQAGRPSARSRTTSPSTPPPAARLELKQAVCDRHATDFGTAYTPAECIVTVGGKHAIFNLDPGADQSRRRGDHPGALLGHLQGRGQLRRRQVRVRRDRRGDGFHAHRGDDRAAPHAAHASW